MIPLELDRVDSQPHGESAECPREEPEQSKRGKSSITPCIPKSETKEKSPWALGDNDQYFQHAW